MRQTCGQRSNMAAASKCRALAVYFSVRICYMLLISKCKGEYDLGLCVNLGMLPLLLAALLEHWPHVSHILITFDHIWITANGLVRFHKNEFDKMPCKLDTTVWQRIRIVSRNSKSYLNPLNRIDHTIFSNFPQCFQGVNVKKNRILVGNSPRQFLGPMWLVGCSPPHHPLSLVIKVGLGISRTNADSQSNPVYNAFHRFFCSGNETIRR